MRADRVIPPASGLDTSVPLYGNGFGSPLTGATVRREPTVTIPSISVQTMIDLPRSNATPGIVPPKFNDPTSTPPPPSYQSSDAAGALATSSSATPGTDWLKDNWMWLAVAGLVVAAVAWK